MTFAGGSVSSQALHRLRNCARSNVRLLILSPHPGKTLACRIHDRSSIVVSDKPVLEEQNGSPQHQHSWPRLRRLRTNQALPKPRNYAAGSALLPIRTPRQSHVLSWLMTKAESGMGSMVHLHPSCFNTACRVTSQGLTLPRFAVNPVLLKPRSSAESSEPLLDPSRLHRGGDTPVLLRLVGQRPQEAEILNGMKGFGE